MNIDLFGNPITEKYKLKDEFLIPPFSIFDTASGEWQSRKNKWKNLGIKSEIGRGNDNTNQRMTSDGKMKGLKSKASAIIAGTDDYRSIKNKAGYDNKDNYVSIFDPVLCEVLYKWFVPKNGSILDPFAGGSVRGIVANYLDYRYTGIDLSERQVDANIQQGIDIVPDNQPTWICGDSDDKLNTMDKKYDFIFSCPPYYDLEVYSDDRRDLSTMDTEEFHFWYYGIIGKACMLLKDNSFACFVVGNVRDKDGYLRDLMGHTIKAFETNNVRLYNEIILKNAVASASMRAKGNMTYKKVVKIHQNVLVFCKGDFKKASEKINKGEQSENNK